VTAAVEVVEGCVVAGAVGAPNREAGAVVAGVVLLVAAVAVDLDAGKPPNSVGAVVFPVSVGALVVVALLFPNRLGVAAGAEVTGAGFAPLNRFDIDEAGVEEPALGFRPPKRLVGAGVLDACWVLGVLAGVLLGNEKAFGASVVTTEVVVGPDVAGVDEFKLLNMPGPVGLDGAVPNNPPAAVGVLVLENKELGPGAVVVLGPPNRFELLPAPPAPPNKLLAGF
jgi:hypothetical protein